VTTELAGTSAGLPVATADEMQQASPPRIATTPPAMAAPRATIAKSSLAVQVVAGARLGEAALGIKATLD